MGIFDRWNKKSKQVDESIKAFKKPIEKFADVKATGGEGFEDATQITGFGNIGLSSFNMFYDRYINQQYTNELQKIYAYREMALNTEVSDIIEDACNESIYENEEGQIVHLNIKNKKDNKLNKNARMNIQKEFDKLFYENIEDLSETLWNMFMTYMIDGRVYYERVIDIRKPKNGIINIKKLPTETMDYKYDAMTGKIVKFYQYLKGNPKKPLNDEDITKDPHIIEFEPDQIGFINYGIFGKSKNDIFGYLEKSRIPYNQLKLLETSVIIYRIVRSPERLVFRIDTGNMPKDKAMKYVEKIKQKMTKKQTYNPVTGALSHEPEVMCIRPNTIIPLTDGRNLTLKEIIQEYNQSILNHVYTINQETYKIEEKPITNAAITRPNQTLIRIWLENDLYIDVTPDHKFLVWKDNKIMEIEAQNLTEDMELVDNEERI